MVKLDDALTYQIAQVNSALQCEHALLIIASFLRIGYRLTDTEAARFNEAIEPIRGKLAEKERDAWRIIDGFAGISERAKAAVNKKTRHWFEGETNSIMSMLGAWNSYCETDEKAFRAEVLKLFE